MISYSSTTNSQNNILFVANYESDVGYAWWLMDNFWSEIAHYFKNRNVQCYIIYPKLNSLPEVIEKSPIQTFELDFSNREIKNLKKLKSIINENRIETIYLTDKKVFDSIYFRLRIWGIKLIINHVHRGVGDGKINTAKNALKKIVHIISIFSCHHYIAVSNFVKTTLIQNACVPKKRCVTIRNGIIPIVIESKYKNYARTLFGLDNDSILIVSTGRAVFSKGIDFIIECANIVINRKKKKNVCFIYCGDGPDLKEFKKLSQKYLLEQNFIFAGFRNDINEIVQSCDIAIHASNCEAFSLSILEYLSAGLPTLAPKVGGNIEAIKHGVTGFLYTQRNLFEVVDRILYLLENKELKEQIGKRAVASVNKNFSIQRTNLKLIKFFENLLYVNRNMQ